MTHASTQPTHASITQIAPKLALWRTPLVMSGAKSVCDSPPIHSQAKIRPWSGQISRIQVYSHETKSVCCTTRDGAKTKEEKDAGTVNFPPYNNEWVPTIPPWSGDYTMEILGRKIGVKYGIRFDVGFGGSVEIGRTKRECQGDKCWNGTIAANFDVGGGPFGSAPNPASDPLACGPEGAQRPCDAIRLQGNLKVGINVQAGVNCEKVEGKIGHNGVTINAKFILAEGSWVEVGGSRSWVLVNSGDILPVIDIPLSN